MKKILVICLLLFVLIGVYGCGSDASNSSSNVKTSNSTVSEETSKTSNSEAAKTDKADIKVSVPEGWTPVAGSVLPVQYMKNTASFMMKTEKFSGKTLDDVVKEAKDIFGKTFKNVEYIGDAETITVDGKDARKFIFSCEVSKMKMKYEYVYVFVGSEIYAITFGDLEGTFDSLAQDYEQILNKISF